jgi:cell division protein FtsZ
VRGVTDLMVMPGLINLDFADVRTVMAEMGTAMMGTGEGDGGNRALEAARGAMANPLLDITSMRGARGVLINITGGFDMTLYEVDQAANEIRAEVDSNANIILGSTFDESLEGRMRVAVVATGIDDEHIVNQQTLVEPARRASEAPLRRPAVPQRGEPASAPAPEPVSADYEPARPNFANDIEEPRRGGFLRFGWRKPEPRPELQDYAAEPQPRRAREDIVSDPALDEELEIPAFLRRQVNPR